MNDLADELETIDATIIAFATAMREKMHSKAIAGVRGWDNPDNKIFLRNMLHEHLGKDSQTAKQMVDVANFAMMLWLIEILEGGTPADPPSIVTTFDHLRQEFGHHFDHINSPDDLLG